MGALLALGARLLPGIGRIMGGVMGSDAAGGIASKLGPGMMASKLMGGGGGQKQQPTPYSTPTGMPGPLGNLPIPAAGTPTTGKTAVEIDDPSTKSVIPGAKADDPEEVDQHEINDGDRDLGLQVGQDVNDIGGTDQGPDDFHPDSEGAQGLEAMLPKLLEILLSGQSGADDPEVQDLHNKLEAEIPGYLNHAGSDDDAAHMITIIMGGDPGQQAGDPSLKDNDAPHDPISNPDEDEALKESRFAEHLAALPGVEPFVPMPDHSQDPPMQGLAGQCPMCHATLDPQSATCPQCGMGNSSTRMADVGNTQGPNTDEQKAAVAQLLQESGRGEEVPNMITQPWEYADELAQITQDDAPPEPPADPSGPQSPTDTMQQAPPGAGMPMPGMSAPGGAGGQMMAAIHRYANQVDSLADPCPNCGSHSTGYHDDDGGCSCKTCGHAWKSDSGLSDESTRTAAPHDEGQNVEAVPAADQQAQEDPEREQDSSHTWQDVNGQPLKVGAEYKMYSSNYSIPDIIRISAVKPEAFEYINTGEHGLNHSAEVSFEEAQLENLSFEPFNEQPEGIDDPELEENMEDIGRPSPGQDQTDLSTPHMQMAKTADGMDTGYGEGRTDELPWDQAYPFDKASECPQCGGLTDRGQCPHCGYDQEAQSERNYFNQADPAYQNDLRGYNMENEEPPGYAGDDDWHHGRTKESWDPGPQADIGPEQNPDPVGREPTNVFNCRDCGAEMQRFRGMGDMNCPHCGAAHNSFGQRLADPSQWGEETGESYSDIQNPHDPESPGYPYEAKTANPESINLEPDWEGMKKWILNMARTDLQQAVKINNEMAGYAWTPEELAQAAGVSPEEVQMMSGGMGEVQEMTGPGETQHPLGPQTGKTASPFPADQSLTNGTFELPPSGRGVGPGIDPLADPACECGHPKSAHEGEWGCTACEDEDNAQGIDPGVRANHLFAPAQRMAHEAGETGPDWLLEDSHTAGAKFTPMEQQGFIDESGEARNMDKLDIGGTHYEAARDAEEMFPFGAPLGL